MALRLSEKVPRWAANPLEKLATPLDTAVYLRIDFRPSHELLPPVTRAEIAAIPCSVETHQLRRTTRGAVLALSEGVDKRAVLGSTGASLRLRFIPEFPVAVNVGCSRPPFVDEARALGHSQASPSKPSLWVVRERAGPKARLHPFTFATAIDDRELPALSPWHLSNRALDQLTQGPPAVLPGAAEQICAKAGDELRQDQRRKEDVAAVAEDIRRGWRCKGLRTPVPMLASPSDSTVGGYVERRRRPLVHPHPRDEGGHSVPSGLRSQTSAAWICTPGSMRPSGQEATPGAPPTRGS